MQIAINFKNETVAHKVLWFLEHFKNDGVEIIKIDDSDETILNNFKQGIKELELAKNGKLETKKVEAFLDEL
jgi:glutamate dehydrogenase/leucine dehydrogenase